MLPAGASSAGSGCPGASPPALLPALLPGGMAFEPPETCTPSTPGSHGATVPSPVSPGGNKAAAGGAEPPPPGAPGRACPRAPGQREDGAVPSRSRHPRQGDGTLGRAGGAQPGHGEATPGSLPADGCRRAPAAAAAPRGQDQAGGGRAAPGGAGLPLPCAPRARQPRSARAASAAGSTSRPCPLPRPRPDRHGTARSGPARSPRPGPGGGERPCPCSAAPFSSPPPRRLPRSVRPVPRHKTSRVPSAGVAKSSPGTPPARRCGAGPGLAPLPPPPPLPATLPRRGVSPEPAELAGGSGGRRGAYSPSPGCPP